jgi:hypothetical protein
MIDYYPSNSPQPLEPIFYVAFDQLIDREAVLASIEVTADNRAVSLRLATEAEIAADERVSFLAENAAENAAEGRWLAFRALEPLPTEASIQVIIPPGTPSAEGPLTTTEAQSFSFQTYAQLRITNDFCGWYSGSDCPPFTPFFIEFNNAAPDEPAICNVAITRVNFEVISRAPLTSEH